MKTKRPIADYFKASPQADPLAAQAGQKASESQDLSTTTLDKLLPKGVKVGDTAHMQADGVDQAQIAQRWAKWVDQEAPVDDNQDEPEKSGGLAAKGRSALDLFVSRYDSSAVDSPKAVIDDAAVRLKNVENSNLRSHTDDGGLAYLRGMAESLAKEAHNATCPVFRRSKVEGFESSDMPLPGTSFALMGIRGSVGRQRVTTAKIEADRLYYDGRDLRHGSGANDLTTAPFSAMRARKMQPGERYKISTEQSVLVENGLKYTATMLPGVSSSMVHDLGPSVGAEMIVAVEGETSMELVRGFGSKVALRVSSTDDRVHAGNDRQIKAGVGLFVDASLGEYLTKTFTRMAGRQVEDELKTLEGQKNYMDLRLMPYADRVNKKGELAMASRHKKIEGNVTLYEVVFDLEKQEAKEIFNRVVGAKHGDKPQQIDFSALSNLGSESGVEVVTNNITKASRKAAEKTFAAFGYHAQRSKIEESSSSEIISNGEKKRVFEDNFSTQRSRQRRSGDFKESMIIARAKTVKGADDSVSAAGVGLGLHYMLDANEAGVSEIADLLTLAGEIESTPNASVQLENLLDNAGDLKRRKVLGLPMGERKVGPLTGELRVELNADAVNRLLKKVSDPASQKDLWTSLSTAYAKRHRSKKEPQWPVPTLMRKDWLGAARRRLFTFKASDDAFLAANNGMQVLQKAADTKDPKECARLLSEAFDFFRHDPGTLGVFINAAKSSESTDCESLNVDFQLSGETGALNRQGVDGVSTAPDAVSAS
ncbi:MAG: hypothetical protein QGI45_00595 [Myxococcota bacterium]|nr:hypothetical protein [Myxococcota bacterium]